MVYEFSCNKASTFPAFQVFLEIPDSPSNPTPPLPTPHRHRVSAAIMLYYKLLSPTTDTSAKIMETLFFRLRYRFRTRKACFIQNLIVNLSHPCAEASV